ncbi:MAG: ferritin family protein, partial [Nitrospirota bacterium]|nr:ferritin family protein [Nitrospirota bacterium]
MNIFDCAIKMEQEARKFYENLAADATDPELQNLFTLLAESEQEHHDALVKIKKDIDHLKVEFKDLQEAACLFNPAMTKRDSAAEQMEQPDGYQRIVKQEENNVQFYEDLAEQTKDENTRKVLFMIAKEERKHLSIVKNIYSFVESPK